MATTPDQLGALGLWLKPESLAGANGSAITSWADSSGNGWTVTQATGTMQPTVTTGALNGYSGATFDGTDDCLFVPSGGLGLVRNRAGFTVSVVYRPSTVTGQARCLFSASINADATTNRAFLEQNANNTASHDIGGRRLDADARVALTNTASPPIVEYAVSTGTFQYASGRAMHHYNGASRIDTTFQTAGNTPDTDSARIAIGADCGLVLAANGVIVEVIAYTRDLTTFERALVHTYEQNKFGITVSDFTTATDLPANRNAMSSMGKGFR